MLENYLDIKLFIKDVNALRLSNVNKWHFIDTVVNNKIVKIKLFNTYLQVYTVDGVRYGGLMDTSIKDFKSELLNGVS